MSDRDVVNWYKHQFDEADCLKDITFIIESYMANTTAANIDCEAVLNLTKAVRQDMCKIFLSINRMNWLINERNKNNDNREYLMSGIMGNRLNEFQGIDIEYFWIKYRSLLDYSLELLAAFFPELKSKKYGVEDKYAYLNDMFGKNDKLYKLILSGQWYDGIRKIRNQIVHIGATCLVFPNNASDDILFQIYDLDHNELYKDYEEHQFNSHIYYFEKAAVVYLAYLYLYYEILSISIIAKKSGMTYEKAVEYVNTFPTEDYMGKCSHVNYENIDVLIDWVNKYLGCI